MSVLIASSNSLQFSGKDIVRIIVSQFLVIAENAVTISIKLITALIL